MFLRKKPPQLTFLEELQQTYNDCCETTIKNLYLEEDKNDVESALKGWKSLHTSLLYKLELFEKKKITSVDELQILQELKNIRDQNVKHLIRVQLRMDEINRKKHFDPSREAAILSLSNSASSKSSGPSLRSTHSNSSTNNRSMLKSLRPQASSLSSSTTSIPTSNGNGSSTSSYFTPSNTYHTSKVAAKLMYQPNKPHIHISHPQTYQPPSIPSQSQPLASSEDELFDDFDEEEAFDFVSNDYGNGNGHSSNNWERLNVGESRTSSGISELSSGKENSTYNNNLIDIDDDGSNFNNYNLNGESNSQRQFNKSFEDILTIKKVPPPIPPKRNGNSAGHLSVPTTSKPKSNSFDQNYYNDSSDNLLSTMGSTHSKSTGDITIKPIIESPQKESKPVEVKKKPYVYNKPKPLNVSHIMKKTSQTRLKQQQAQQAHQSQQSSSTQKTTSSQPSQQQAKQQQKPKAQAAKLKPKASTSNINYNYVKKTTPTAKKSVSPPPSNQPTKREAAPSSPTMDDLLSGYDAEEDGDVYDDGDDVPTYLKNDTEQDKLIASIRGIDVGLAKQILNDIVVQGDEVYWDDIVGLEAAKNSLKEAVVYPFLRPDLFQGLREPVRGMLLFGPPGTGKTMLARAVATESKSTFFQINSSSLTSKYLGESEKLVKALFLLAKKLSPSIIFMDEIDSLLGSRTEGELESMRRVKNEFLISWSELSSATANASSKSEDNRVLILGATNLPWAIDEAARRRFARRQYIPLPDGEIRINQIKRLLKYQNNTITDDDFLELIELTEGFSGSDITSLAKDSAMGPLRELGEKLLLTPTDQIRSINIEDFKNSLKYIRPSVSKEGLKQYEDWSDKFGSSGM
ncbi:P-loop containing nucleoside triphosphate hydrolase protein [Scheffersomyces coipomensis]|uniref:P-loop containing nucleoside triphosphate hydrolase protein n=1 Tax=Scheffersomyces coipomensis TaxID=1788519 RepID=UPI00315DDC63